MQERRGEHAPRFHRAEFRGVNARVPEQFSETRHNDLRQEEDGAQTDDREGDYRTSLTDCAAEDRLVYRRVALCLVDTVNALNPDGSRTLALRAGRPAAPLTPHVTDPVRVARAYGYLLVRLARRDSVGHGLLGLLYRDAADDNVLERPVTSIGGDGVQLIDDGA
ncbi:hypothetical protein GCM10027403_19590 [Arthrobacter tecti]